MKDNSVGTVSRAEQPPPMPRSDDQRPAEIAALLDKVQTLLDQQQPAKALELLRHAKPRSPWITNASAVCQMRQGNAAVAVQSLRSLVLAGLCIRQDLPAVFKINYATALLAANDLNGCLTVLAEINQEAHPGVKRLRSAIAAWKSRLSRWQRIWWWIGGDVDRCVAIDFPPGELS